MAQGRRRCSSTAAARLILDGPESMRIVYSKLCANARVRDSAHEILPGDRRMAGYRRLGALSGVAVMSRPSHSALSRDFGDNPGQHSPRTPIAPPIPPTISYRGSSGVALRCPGRRQNNAMSPLSAAGRFLRGLS